jgi:hypothetical protein
MAPGKAAIPVPSFTDWYRCNCADVRHAGLNPLRHYCQYDTAEGRSAAPDCELTRHTTALIARSGPEQHAAMPVGAVDYRVVKKPQVIAADQNVIFVTYLPRRCGQGTHRRLPAGLKVERPFSYADSCGTRPTR